ncbi:sensor histidine kinase [Streptomyces griseus]|uniref:sensor histidine kinase n=1 Tax=Streptomyces griseus TaxID=1911 RepID=UPI000840519C|nr:HAMP domain-containing sensor histidine kinase [Streptomyces griseus]
MRRRAEGGKADGRRLPLRKSLLGRMLAVSALVASCSVAATAWLAVQTTSGAIEQEQGENLTAGARIHDTLLGYAARHPTWDGVGPTVRALADSSDRRITLTTQRREILADSAAPSPRPPDLPAQASAVVDPLSVDTAPTAGTPVAVSLSGPGGAFTSRNDRVDPRAVGPFRLPPAERTSLRRTAERTVRCLNAGGIASNVVETTSGRPRIQLVGNDPGRLQGTRCATEALDSPTGTEKKALTALNALVDACLDRQGREPVRLGLDLAWGTDTGAATAEPVARDEAGRPAPAPRDGAARESLLRPTPVPAPATAPTEAPPVRDSADERAVDSCVGTARREQLGSYVAAPALLFVSDPGGTSVPGLDLSPANTARIVGVAALVLALTVGASFFAGIRLVRPLRALTGAAQRMRDGVAAAPEPVVVTSDNEIGRLATAFNDMSAHRARLEEQRKVMVSDVAHELRTPLSNIRGWLEGAQDGVAAPDAAFVSSLLEEAVQLQHIIDDLQDLSAADAGMLRLHPEPVRIGSLLAHVAAAHQAQAEAAEVTLTVAAGTPALTLTADPVRLRQAVGNLVSNAVRHTPAGGRVTLRAYAGEDGGVAVEVADTGSGIPPENLPYVFERFWRAEKSRSRRTGGSGLGLAIVRKLTEAHGGTADVVSTVGEGSVFTLRLPESGPDAMDTAR